MLETCALGLDTSNYTTSAALLQNGNPSLLLAVVYLALCLPGG